MNGAPGFTLIELMLGLLVGAIVLAAGVPAWRSMVESNRMAAAANEVVSQLSFARMRAIRERSAVFFEAADPDVSGVFTGGWIIWADRDGNGARGADETLRIGDGLRGRITAVSLDGDRILGFTGRGESALDHVTRMELCPGGNDTRGRLIRIGVSGRISLLRDHVCP